MRCPLAVIENDESLAIVRNGKIEQAFPFPQKPYVLIPAHCDAASLAPGAEIIKKTDLWTKTEIELAKVEFDRIGDARAFYRGLQDTYQDSDKRTAYFHGMKETLLLEQPDYFRQFAQTDPIRTLYLDIECLADGSGVFPRPNKAPIVSITVKTRVGNVKSECITWMNYSDDRKDIDIIESFIKFFKDFNADIIVGYNVWFDLSYIFGRIQKLNRDGLMKNHMYSFCRDGSLPISLEDKDNVNDTMMKYKIIGRIVMDLYEDVVKDQSLLGIKNKKLKTVCKWFDIPAIEVDTRDMRPFVNTPQLKEYNQSDVNAVDVLYDIYYPQQEELADMMGIPLDDAINGHNSFIPRIYTGRRLISLGYIPMQNNYDRYGDTKFEAAYVDILKKGRFETIYKVDFASLYPTIMMTFNLGPDTVKILSFNSHDPESFSIVADKDSMLIDVPDANFKKNMTIKVDMSKESFIRQDMLKLFDMRKEIKTKLRTASGAEKTALTSKSWAIKVLMNTIFGFEGLKYARFGDMGTGVAIVALGRWLIKAACKHLGDSVIEVDTDGIYVDKDVDVDFMNNMVTAMVHETIGKTSYLKFEKEGPWLGYFYKAKNYVLMEDGEITLHGGALKSSKHTKLFDKAVNELATAVLAGANHQSLLETVQQIRDLSHYELNEFLLHMTLGKTNYKDDGAMQVGLMKQAAEVMKRKIVMGDSIDYYKVPEGYLVTEKVTSVDQLDKAYYLKSMDKAQEIFDLQDIHKTPEEIEAERRAERRLALIARKRKLNEYIRGDVLDDPEVGHPSMDDAKKEVEKIEILQEAMLKKWPCTSCSGIKLEIKYPDGLACACGWIGIPSKPPRKAAVHKTKKATAILGIDAEGSGVPF